MIGLAYSWGAIGIVILTGYFYLRCQSKKIAEQKQQIERIKVEAKAIAEEMENAEKRKQIEQANQRLNDDSIDKQLQSKSYFRD
ncbi:hypothetical protein CEP48_03135 [Mergibacter septicus]|uniref:Uncharacterized protein n=1 Tax=Mergibacter septicus TaxID=221402 RepID=A0A8D4IWP4_9PAST|nr:DUF2681 domain-containing protein [Mergibacter septicus]AWX15218.1 hypothetical protein CEP47_03135 [Mergibacter septicus]QDJ14472.1 hypothetical protein CEP48_03135 [Mergibacter septicus]UTU48090.1 DUF2681 domain-containing protein [Mergibacter septicus]WMR96297.1 DUF2681 domain-containing protein [Mergibacter septicus]